MIATGVDTVLNSKFICEFNRSCTGSARMRAPRERLMIAITVKVCCTWIELICDFQ